jgi:drug/metabolite transporter (DMT)-like permease
VLFIAKPPFLFGNAEETATPIALPDEMAVQGAFETELEVIDEALNQLDATSTANASREAFLRFTGVVAGILGAIFVAFALISIKKLSKKAHILEIVSYFHWMAVPLSILAGWMMPSELEPFPWILPRDPVTWILLLTAAICGVLGQVSLSFALQLEKVSKAATMNYVQVAFAFLGEWIVWGVIPNAWSFLGAAIVILCTGIVTFIKIHQK